MLSRDSIILSRDSKMTFFTCLIGRTISIIVETTFLLCCRAILGITLIRNAKSALICEFIGPTPLPKIYHESLDNFLDGLKQAIKSRFRQSEHFYSSVALFWPIVLSEIQNLPWYDICLDPRPCTKFIPEYVDNSLGGVKEAIKSRFRQRRHFYFPVALFWL